MDGYPFYSEKIRLKSEKLRYAAVGGMIGMGLERFTLPSASHFWPLSQK